MASKRVAWADLKQERGDHPETAAGYQRARRGFELGQQIRRIRLARGWTQRELGQHAGTTQTTIARIEGGAGIPTIDSLERIGRALDADLVVRFEEHQATAALH